MQNIERVWVRATGRASESEKERVEKKKRRFFSLKFGITHSGREINIINVCIIRGNSSLSVIIKKIHK